MILVGDIGGTKTQLALYQLEHPLNSGSEKARFLARLRPKQLFFKSYSSASFADFDTVLSQFLIEAELSLQNNVIVHKAALAIAGPVEQAVCRVTNLAWTLSASQLAKQLKIKTMILINDLQATAYAVPFLPNQDFVSIQKGLPLTERTLAVIAPGTGLGEAILYWDGSAYHALATEAGHADFAPVDEQQIAFVNNCRLQDGDRFNRHVSVERVLSGQSIADIYQFLYQRTTGKSEPPLLADHASPDWSALVSNQALNNDDALCVASMELFASMLAAEAGNLALRSLAYGGLVIAGGIAPKILPLLNTELFRQHFSAKGRFQNLLQQVPVSVCINPQAPMLGALYWVL